MRVRARPGCNDFREPYVLCVTLKLNGRDGHERTWTRPAGGPGMSASRSEITDAPGAGGREPGPPGADLLAALLDGMDAALCAFDAAGVVTHWNREAERILGWSAREAVGRRGFAGWAVRSADAAEVQGRLMAAMDA